MSGKRPRFEFEDEILEAMLEDERAAFISHSPGGQLDDDVSWLSLAELTRRDMMPATLVYAERFRPLE